MKKYTFRVTLEIELIEGDLRKVPRDQRDWFVKCRSSAGQMPWRQL